MENIVKYYNGKNRQEILSLLKKDNILIRYSSEGIIGIIDSPKEIYKGYFIAEIPHFNRHVVKTEIIHFDSGQVLNYCTFLELDKNKEWSISNRLKETVDKLSLINSEKENLLTINSLKFRTDSIYFLENYFNDLPMSKSFIESMCNIWFHSKNFINE